MPGYTLNLGIDQESLKIITAAQQQIVLARPVDGASPNVVWVAFRPFEDNSVTWVEEFGLYASTTEFQSGAEIVKMSHTDFPAQDGMYYSFDATATFSGPFSGAQAPPLGSYRTYNNMPEKDYPALTFGLQQVATVNGKPTLPTPVNAVSVLANEQVTFTPLTTVYAWLQSTIVSATMISDVQGNSAKVVFGDGVTTASLRYDPTAGRFVSSTSSLPPGLKVSHYDRSERLFAPQSRR
ncbi:hypothetical protein LVJ94_26615 [Pendulispora rubella]|uniref:Uncharacterized protein n=1 Tax=Pendulispora rubella TaxID=2741070 RepID=A0ABZ2KP97_9BACT